MRQLFDPNPVAASAPSRQIVLRDYQQKATDRVFEEWQGGAKTTLLVLPTGTGKTVVAAHVIKEKMKEGRIMVVAHREELIRQAVASISQICNCYPDIEMADYWADQNGKAKVVVSTIQTQVSGQRGEGRMTRFNPDEFSLLWIDEFHHATASTYRKVIGHYTQNPRLKVLGVTATPDRADEEALGQVCDTVAMDYEIVDAIDDGWLVNIEQKYIQCSAIDLSSVKRSGNDLNQTDLAKVMEYEAALHQVVGPLMQEAGDRKAIVFTSSVEHARRTCEIINRHRADSAAFVCGKTPKEERRKILHRFSSKYGGKQYQYLCNVGCFTEGFDEPAVEVIAVARPTKSRSLYAQMAGRGTRPLPGIVDGKNTAHYRKEAIKNSSKPSMMLLDFVGNSGVHKLMSGVDILGGRESDEVGKVAKRIIEQEEQTEGKGMDVQEAIEKAKAEVERAIKERAALVAKTQHRAVAINPFDIFDLTPRKGRAWDKGRQPTPKQQAFLRKCGIKDKDADTFTKASQVIDTLIKRMNNNKASYKMVKLLRKHHHPRPLELTFQEASAAINALSGNRWSHKGLW